MTVWTNKIHELQLKEQELQEQLSNERGSPTPTSLQQSSDYNAQDATGPQTPSHTHSGQPTQPTSTSLPADITTSTAAQALAQVLSVSLVPRINF